jgi:hypothetical protein
VLQVHRVRSCVVSPVSAFQPGWVDRIAPAVATKEEHTRATAMGLVPRRNFRIDRARRAASAALGGQRGAVTKAARRKLAAQEDE